MKLLAFGLFVLGVAALAYFGLRSRAHDVPEFRGVKDVDDK